jgi:hypothetical protein
MNWYVVLLKIDPNHTDDVVQHLRKLPKNPMPDINLCYSYNVFGTWDACMWFWANTHDNAMNFVQKYIRNIPWVTETNTLPTTTIKEYK